MIRRALLLAIAATACALATTASAAGPATLQPKLTAALTSSSLSLGRTSALAIDVATGTVLYAHNSSLAVAPASNEKIPVSWAALTSLGPRYRFHTEVYGTGVRAGATWDGDLILKGFGDPTLSTADLDRLAGTIAGRGIRTISGRVLGDESFYDRKRGAAGWKHYFIGGETRRSPRSWSTAHAVGPHSRRRSSRRGRFARRLPVAASPSSGGPAWASRPTLRSRSPRTSPTPSRSSSGT